MLHAQGVARPLGAAPLIRVCPCALTWNTLRQPVAGAAHVSLPLLLQADMLSVGGSGELRRRGSGRPGPDSRLSRGDPSGGVPGARPDALLGCRKYAHTFAMSVAAPQRPRL